MKIPYAEISILQKFIGGKLELNEIVKQAANKILQFVWYNNALDFNRYLTLKRMNMVKVDFTNTHHPSKLLADKDWVLIGDYVSQLLR